MFFLKMPLNLKNQFVIMAFKNGSDLWDNITVSFKERNNSHYFTDEAFLFFYYLSK
jgi:hypothetical protein